MRFDMICDNTGVEHRLTKPNHPSITGQVERMNRTIKKATIKRDHYDSHDQLHTYLANFLAVYNAARTLETIGTTFAQKICNILAKKRVPQIHTYSGQND